MAKHSKRFTEAAKKVDAEARHTLGDGVKVLLDAGGAAKFDETVELAVRLGVDPRQADQNVRGTVLLPHGTGKTVRVLVFAKGEKAKEAQDAGADVVLGLHIGQARLDLFAVNVGQQLEIAPVHDLPDTAHRELHVLRRILAQARLKRLEVILNGAFAL